MSKRLDELDRVYVDSITKSYPAIAALIKSVEAFIDIFDNNEDGITAAYGAMKEARRKFEEGEE